MMMSPFVKCLRVEEGIAVPARVAGVKVTDEEDGQGRG